jgi:hypothetical protein
MQQCPSPTFINEAIVCTWAQQSLFASTSTTTARPQTPTPTPTPDCHPIRASCDSTVDTPLCRLLPLCQRVLGSSGAGPRYCLFQHQHEAAHKPRHPPAPPCSALLSTPLGGSIHRATESPPSQPKPIEAHPMPGSRRTKAGPPKRECLAGR